jgi:hypothetical protein
MARNQVMRLLGQADKGASGTYGAGGVLSRLWRQQLKDLGINIQRWNDLMYKFVTDPRNGYPNNKRDQQSARGNLTKEFARPQMTWKVFMKAQRFLGVKDLTIAIECNFIDGRRSVHSAPVNFGLPTPAPTNGFIQEVRQEPNFASMAATMEFMEATEEQFIYTELEDDAAVRGLIYQLCNPYAEPYDEEGLAIANDINNTRLGEQTNRGYEPGTETFAGSYLGKRTYEQYLADKQITG